MDTKFRIHIADIMSLLADITAKEASVLNEIIEFTQDSEAISKKINSLETDADMIVHAAGLELRESGIILDDKSQDYYMLIYGFEECTDVIEDLAIAYNSYNVTSLREDYIPMLVAIEQASQTVVTLAAELRNPNKFGPIQLSIIELNHSRHEGVKMFSEAMRNLFTFEKDPIEIIRWKEIYSLTRDIFITYEDLADACEEFILKYSR